MIRKSKIIAFILVLFLIALAVPQTRSANDTKSNPFPFSANEELIYHAEFSKAIFRGLNIGEIRFKVTRKQEPTQLYNITADAESKGFATKLFGINFRQLVDSTVEPTNFRSLKTNKLDQQGKRVRKSETVFDKENGKVTWTETDPNQPNKPPRVVTNQFNGDVQDIASGFYFVRLQPLKVGQSFTVKLHDSGTIYDVAVKVTQRKQLKTILGKVWAVKVEPDIFGGKLLDGEGSMEIWFTDDARHIPVKSQIKFKLGTVDFKLKKINNVPQ
jgi:hypothetical protein